MKQLLLVLVGAAGCVGMARADDKPDGQKEGHLGIGVGPVPAVLRSQLPATLPDGQGVLVEQVAKNSPGAQAGVQVHDILLSYGGQKLTSPEQLVRLVRHDRPGQEVSLALLRGGKTTECKVTLGESRVPAPSETPRVFRLFPDEQTQKAFEELESKRNESSWELLDGIKLTRQEGNRWRAEVEYRTKEGKKDSKVFTGTREDLHKAIETEKDLPEAERIHLLRALDFRPPIFEFHFPPLGTMNPAHQP
jgi:membrane-associated protease RseP (regulator of RpoE activity)